MGGSSEMNDDKAMDSNAINERQRGGGDGRRQDVVANRALEGPIRDVYEKKQCRFGHLVSLEMIILWYTMIVRGICCVIASAPPFAIACWHHHQSLRS